MSDEFTDGGSVGQGPADGTESGKFEHAAAARLINVEINSEMRKSFLDYSMSVITSRALPDVRDGLKPVHRRILYNMFERGLSPDKAYRKCADTVGSVLGAYHPHGDASVYDAMVRMAQDFSMRYMLVDGHGNFGSVDGDPPAAYRYTESRMSKISTEMLTDIDKETVDFMPNYDDRLKEPTVLPSRFPNLLVNGSTGIAVGMATNIPPHNLAETVDAMDCLIDNPDASLDDLMQHIKGPDFPTAGIIMGRAGIRAAYGTGRGKITLRAKADIEENSNGRFSIVVTELPYQVNKSKLIEQIADLVKEKRIEGISDINDYSSREGMKMVIDLKRDANPQLVLNQLYTYSQLQISYGIIMLALVKGEPKILTLKEMLLEYIDFQCEVVERRTRYDLNKALERLHILDALHTALDYIDEIIAILRRSASIPEGKQALMDRFGFDEIQATYVVQMRLGQLTGLERQKIDDEIAALNEKVAAYREILSSRANILAVVRTEVGAIRDKYKDERRTEIQNVSGEVDDEALIPVEDCVFTLTGMGYIKRVATETYKSQRRGGKGIKGMTRREDDVAEQMFTCSSHDWIMFITDKGTAYRLKGYEIPSGSRDSKGMNIVNLLPVESGEKICTMLRMPTVEDGKFLTMVTRSGVIKRTQLGEFSNIRRNGLRAIVFNEGDMLVGAAVTNGNDRILIATRKGRAVAFYEENARCVGRTAKGVIGIRLRKEDDEVVGFTVLSDEYPVLTVSRTGFGRLTPASDYPLHGRGTGGQINYHVEKNGDVAFVGTVDPAHDLIMISSDGILIRLRADSINTHSRISKGVKVMNVRSGEYVATVAETEREEEQPAPEDDADVSDDPGNPENTEKPDNPVTAETPEDMGSGE